MKAKKTDEKPYQSFDASVATMAAGAKDRWGIPEENQKGLVPYGIRPLDMALYGIDVINGEIVLVQGMQKNRKTTFVLNVLANIMMLPKPTEKPGVIIDTLESGMRRERYFDALTCVVAARKLFELGHTHGSVCKVCGTPVCKELKLTPEYLLFNKQTPAQEEAVTYALDTIASWPINIYDADKLKGNTRALEDALYRWEWLLDIANPKIFVIDHLQQYMFGGDVVTDYEKQIRTVSNVGAFVAAHASAFLVLSQVSMTSAREARDGKGTLTGAGGKKGAEEAATVLTVSYTSGSGIMQVKVEESRRAPVFSVWNKIDDTTGSMYGDASIDPL